MIIPFIRYRVVWYTCSGVLVIGALVAVLLFGLRFGVDFTGGTLMEVSWETSRPSTDMIRSVFDEQGIGGLLVQPIGETGALLRFALVDEAQHTALHDALATHASFREDRFETVGPAIGRELQRKSMWSIIFVILAVTAYVAWAFRKVSKPVASWKYGVITIIALLHDVFLPIGLFALLGYFLNVEVASAFVVALLTILGYSVNDTIVVFDRTRENIAKHGHTKTFEEIVNESVNQTLTRSANTSLTTLLVLIPIFFLGGETIKYFALALIAGVIFGTYSSIFLASPLLVTWYRWGKK